MTGRHRKENCRHVGRRYEQKNPKTGAVEVFCAVCGAVIYRRPGG